MWFKVYQRRRVPINVPLLHVTLHGAAYTQTHTQWAPLPVDGEPSGRAGMLKRGISPFWRCSNSTSSVLLGGRLCLDLSFSIKKKDLSHSVCSTQLFCDGGMSSLTFPIWLVFRSRALLAGISNHSYCGCREARLTCCISRTLLQRICDENLKICASEFPPAFMLTRIKTTGFNL